MHFIDLATQQKRLRNEIDSRIAAVLNHGQYIMGPEIKHIEETLSLFVGVKHGISCASGTDALLLALMAHGVGPGDAVFTSPFTFIATAEVIQLLGATPVYVDIDPSTFNISTDHLLAAVAALRNAGGYPLPNSSKAGLKPKAVISVDLFGLPADAEAINRVASEHGMVILEDAAQSFGAEYKGKRACSLASIGCTSFFPAKPLGCYGDGGMCFTDDPALATTLDSIRVHGKGSDKYDNVRIGINGRMDTLQAAILLAKFSIFPEEVELRQKVADAYSRMLGECKTFQIPVVPSGYKSVWAQYSVLAASEEHRKKTQATLKEAGIPTAVYYPKPLHLQTAFAPLGYREGDFPASEDASRRIFSLPMHPYLSAGDQEKIADVLMRCDG